MKKISTKIFTLNVVILAVALLFLYGFVNILYEKLYVQHTQQNMVEVGLKVQQLYDGGTVEDELINMIEQHSRFLNVEMFVVRDPKELSACLPFDIDYNSLIGVEERKQLLNGEVIVNIGYEERFDRQIVSVVHPLVDEKRLEGIIYQYYPLSDIIELAKEGIFFSAIGGILFLLIALSVMYVAIRKLLLPVAKLQRATKQMKEGDYSVRVAVKTNDEVGELTAAFNEMAMSIQEEDERQKQFLAVVSHELRTPLSYILGYSEAMEKELKSDEKQRHYINIIRNESKRLQKLTSTLLYLTREQHEQAVEQEPIVVAQLVRDVSQLLQLQLQEKSIQLQLQLDEELIAKGDQHQLEQVFINLLGNAIRYSHEGSTVTMEAHAQQGEAVIAVSDNGIGIPAQDLPHVTERFYRVNKARSSADGGAGLGLSIVKQIVQQHGGRMQIESELGRGTTVRIYLQAFD